MRNDFNLHIPFARLSNVEQNNTMASQPNNSGHSAHLIQPMFLLPGFAIKMEHEEFGFIDEVKIRRCDGFETTVSLFDGYIRYWTDDNGANNVMYTGFDANPILQPGNLFQYLVTFENDDGVYYSDWWCPKSMNLWDGSYLTLSIAQDKIREDIAGLPHSLYKGTTYTFFGDLYFENTMIRPINEVEEEIERDLKFNDHVVSTRSERTLLVVVDNCHLPMYDMLVRMQHYVGKGLKLQEQGSSSNDWHEVKSLTIEEPDFESGGEYSPTVRFRLRLEDPLSTTSCGGILTPCDEDYSPPLPGTTRTELGGGISEIITVSVADHEHPENVYATIEYRVQGETEWQQTDYTTMNFIDGTQFAVDPAENYEVRLVVLNHNCRYESLIVTVNTI